jgi:hypothetical protein
VPKDERAREGYLSEMPVHETSCSERLKDYFVAQLQPHGVALCLVLADIYKVTYSSPLTLTPIPTLTPTLALTSSRPLGRRSCTRVRRSDKSTGARRPRRARGCACS